MITDSQQSVFQRYHSDKHFSEFYLQDGGKNPLALDMERNYVTVALCIIKFIKCKPPIIDFTKFEVHSCGVRRRVERRGGTWQLWCTAQGRTTWWNLTAVVYGAGSNDVVEPGEQDGRRSWRRRRRRPWRRPTARRARGLAATHREEEPARPQALTLRLETETEAVSSAEKLRSRLIFWSAGDGLGSRVRRQCGAWGPAGWHGSSPRSGRRCWRLWPTTPSWTAWRRGRRESRRGWCPPSTPSPSCTRASGPAHTPSAPAGNNNNNNNNASGRVFLSKLGRKLADQSGDDREISDSPFWFSGTMHWFTAWLFCEEGGGGVRFIPAWFLHFSVLHSVIFFHSLGIQYWG